MQSLIYVSASQSDAVKTLEELKSAGYSDEQLNLVNRENIINNHPYLSHDLRVEAIEAGICGAIGLSVGIMLAAGIIHLPQASFYSFKGFIIATCLGTAAGLLAGGIIACLTFPLLQWVHNTRYQHLLQNGRFMIFVEGNRNEITHAEKIAHNEDGLHWQYS